MRLTPVLLAAGAGALGASASAHPHDFTPAHNHSLEARSPFSIGLGGINICIGLFCNRPSRSWKCSGSGKDGYSVDYNGNSRPDWAPAGFLYFGADVGWAPPAGWTCSSSWDVPDALSGKLGLVSWWKPTSGWLDARVGLDLGFTAPSWWGFVHAPSWGWSCNGSGKDGFSVDIHGGGRPSWAPSGWLYFGSAIGWAPPAGWTCSSSWDLPSAFVGVIDQVTWWKPSSGWLDAHVGVDLGFTAPSWWGFVIAPSKGWQCNGSGKDGFSIDIYGGGRPSWALSGWLYFGAAIGWAPPAGWTCSSSFDLPGKFVGVIDQITWWKPSSGWLDAHVGVDLGFSAPSWWGFVIAPSKGWQCNGSGKDGFLIDIWGGGRPSWAPAGWLYFGAAIGWAPPAGWTCASSFDLPGKFVGVIDQVTWWKPSSGWIDAHVGVDLGFTAPSWWGFVFAPPKSWTCNGSGKDGWDVDYLGQSRPSWVPSGWAWFGAGAGWQPVKGWSCGSTWEIPSQWRATCSKAGWWAPPSGWLSHHDSHDFGWSLPTHWGIDSCGCSCGCNGGSDGGIRTTTTSRPATTSPARTGTTSCATTTSKKPPASSTTSKKPATSTTKKPVSSTTHKPVSSTTHKPVSSTTHKPAASTSKKPASSTSKKLASSTSKKPATSTSNKPVATKTVTHTNQASTVTIPGEAVTVTRTVSVSVPTPTGRPGYGWTCDGSGKDGWEIDWQGNGRPAQYPEGWFWFGVAIGWAPGASWTCSSNWSPSSLQITIIVNTQITWWLPPAGWVLPSGTRCPAHWTSRGWIDVRIPSPSWQCDGSGEDGYDFDHNGNSRPYDSAIGWKYFGRVHGWQPCKSFTLPSADWEAPAWWQVSHGVWWRPTSRWNLQRGFKCPTTWRSSRSYLRGSWVWH